MTFIDELGRHGDCNIGRSQSGLEGRPGDGRRESILRTTKHEEEKGDRRPPLGAGDLRKEQRKQHRGNTSWSNLGDVERPEMRTATAPGRMWAPRMIRRLIATGRAPGSARGAA